MKNIFICPRGRLSITAAFSAFLMISMLLVSCGEINHRVPLEVKDGLLYIKGTDSLFTGTERAVVQERTIIYDVVKGKKNGSFKILYPDGKPQIIGTMVDNRNEGVWSYYYPGSKLESSGVFKDDLPEGVWKWYFENGDLREVGRYHKGKREGKWLHYDINGNVTIEKDFKEGVEIKMNGEKSPSKK